MKHYKISKLRNDSAVSKFVTRKWIEVNDLSGSQYSVNKNITSKTPMLRSDLCDYIDALIVVKGTIHLLAAPANESDRAVKVMFKNNTPFRLCISKTNNVLVNNAEDFDIVLPMYNLLEYSRNNSMTSGSLWNCYRGQINDADFNESASNGNSFKYKTKLVEQTPERPPQLGNLGDTDQPAQPQILSLNVELAIPLKYISRFWRSRLTFGKLSSRARFIRNK